MTPLDEGHAAGRLHQSDAKAGVFEKWMGSTWFVIAVGAVLGGAIILAGVIYFAVCAFQTKGKRTTRWSRRILVSGNSNRFVATRPRTKHVLAVRRCA